MAGNFPECFKGTNPEKPNENKTKSTMKKRSSIPNHSHNTPKDKVPSIAHRQKMHHNEIAIRLTTDFSTAMREARDSRVSSTR